MRNLFFLLPLFLLLGCKSDEQIQAKNWQVKVDSAQAKISRSVLEGLKDKNSYKPISFGSLDTAYENLEVNSKHQVEDPKSFTGFKMKHNYTARDIFGGNEEYEITYFFPKDINKIVLSVDSLKHAGIQVPENN